MEIPEQEKSVTRKEAYRALRDELARRFPAVFAVDKSVIKPLEIGVYEKLVVACPGWTARDIRFFLAKYCNAPAYHSALIKEKQRFNLDGSPAGEITEENKAAVMQKKAEIKTQQEAARQKKEENLAKLAEIESRKAVHLALMEKQKRKKEAMPAKDVKVTVKKTRTFHYPKDLPGGGE